MSSLCSQENNADRSEKQGTGSHPQHALPGGGSAVRPGGRAGGRAASVGISLASF